MGGRKHVVVDGGGFGGLEAAKALADAPVDVTLVDRTNYHLLSPLLYQVAMAGLSPAEIAAPIRRILAQQGNVHVMLGHVADVDLDGRRALLEDGRALAFGYLVVAVGARSTYFGHDAWERWATGLKTLEDALEIRRRVLVAFEEAELTTDAAERRRLLTFVVIGGGPTGVELAGAVAELARSALSRDFRAIDPRDAKVVLVEGGPRVLASFPEDLSQSAVEQLAELGAEVKVGDRVVAIDERGVELEARGDQDLPGLGTERERISAATVLWAAGVTPSALAARLGAPLDRQGRVVVNEDCSVPGRANVFAIGDMARFEQDGAPLPGASPVAIGQARYVAREIAAGGDRGEHVARPAFRYVDKGSMATIGRSRAIAWARGIKLHGFMAWTAWLVVHIWYLIGFRSRLVVLLTWVWSYPSYGRGARLITSTGWAAAARGGGRTAPSPPAGPRAHEPGPLTSRAASRPS